MLWIFLILLSLPLLFGMLSVTTKQGTCNLRHANCQFFIRSVHLWYVDLLQIRLNQLSLVLLLLPPIKWILHFSIHIQTHGSSLGHLFGCLSLGLRCTCRLCGFLPFEICGTVWLRLLQYSVSCWTYCLIWYSQLAFISILALPVIPANPCYQYPCYSIYKLAISLCVDLW